MILTQAHVDEAIRRVKLSIDRQMSGDIPDSFGTPCKIQIEHADADGQWFPIAVTPLGKFVIDEDGSVAPIKMDLQ